MHIRRLLGGILGGTLRITGKQGGYYASGRTHAEVISNLLELYRQDQ